MPGAAYAAAFLDDDEVVALVLADEVDGCADAGDAGADDQDGGVGVVGVADADFGPGEVAGHFCG